MSRPRSRPEAEASTLDDDLEAMEPLLQALEGGENVRRFREGARGMEAKLPKLKAEYEHYETAIRDMKAQFEKWQAALEQAKRDALAFEQRGIRVQVPA